MSTPLFVDRLRPPDFELFDCHVHIGPSDSGELYYPELTGEEYTELMAAAGVARAFAFAPMRYGGYRDANRSLHAWAARTGGRILPFARLGGPGAPVTRPELWMVRRKAVSIVQSRPVALDMEGPETLDDFAGVKLLPHLDGLPDSATFEAIAARGLPVLVHSGLHCPPAWILRHVVPRVRGPVILAHLGAFPFEESLLRDAVAIAARHDLVYLDTSGAWHSEFLRYAAARVPEKVLFGSDAPLSHPLVAWYHLASVVEHEAVLQRIGWSNAREAFG